MDDEISPMLAPVVALIIWTLILQLWTNVNRLGSIKRKGTRLTARAGSMTNIADDSVEDDAGWNAHNPNHLIEQPTLFYAIAISMALLHTHGDSATNLVLAWAYVFFKIVHTLAQVT